MVGDGEGIDKGIGVLNPGAQKFVKAILVDAFPGHRAAETAQTAAVKGKITQVDHPAFEGQRGAEIGDHIPQVFIPGGAVGDDDHVLLPAFGYGRKRLRINLRFMMRRPDGRRDEQAVLTGEHKLLKKVPCVPLPLLGEQILHVRRQAPHHLHAQVAAVFFHIAMGGHIIEVLGGGDLRGELAGEIHTVRLDELHQPVQLIGRDKRIHRIAEQNQFRLFQLFSQRGKVLFIAFHPLAHRQKGEGVLRMQGLKVQRGVHRGGLLSLGAGVQDKDVHGCSSSSLSSCLYQPISNAAAAMPYSMVYP